MSTLHLACGGSPSYARHTAAMIHSFLEHRGGLDLRVHYLHAPELPRRMRERLRRWVSVQGAELELVAIADRRIAGLVAASAAAHIRPAMWYRTFLPEVLPDVGRVLYVDADVLAVDDVGPLWSTDLGDDVVAAVTNVWEPWNAGYPAKLGLVKPYFNSGVMLMDLDRLRAEDAMSEVLAFARGQDELPWGDQDALNVVLGARRLELAPRWNCMNSVIAFPQAVEVFGAAAVEEARARPGIRHYEGPAFNKPWHLLAPAGERRAYRRHRRATPWPRYVPEGITPRNIRRRLTA